MVHPISPKQLLNSEVNNMTLDEIIIRLKPSLLVEGDSMDSWIESEVIDTLEMILNYINKNTSLDLVELPQELYWILKKMVQVAFTRQRSEGLKNHSEGGEVLSWGDNGYDPLEPYIEALNDYIDGSSKRHSWDFF